MTSSIVFLTYNTHLFGDTFPSATQYYADKERLLRIIELIRERRPDVACLCEVWSDSDKKMISDKLHDIYPYSELHKTNALQMGPGLCVLSKYEILPKRRFCEYTNKDGWDAQAQKGVLGLCIQLPTKQQFRLYFTHMQADDKNSDIRRKQFDQIVNLDMEKEWGNGPAILLGDLNVVANSDEYRWMMSVFSSFRDIGPIPTPTDHAYTADYENNCLNHKFGNSPSTKIDYILAQREWTVDNVQILRDWLWSGSEKYPCQDCSDHYPLIATLRLAA